jgi:hypothetical protein
MSGAEFDRGSALVARPSQGAEPCHFATNGISGGDVTTMQVRILPPVNPVPTVERPHFPSRRGHWQLAAHIIDHEITATDTVLFAAILIGIGAPLTMIAALAALWS